MTRSRFAALMVFCCSSFLTVGHRSPLALPPPTTWSACCLDTPGADSFPARVT